MNGPDVKFHAMANQSLIGIAIIMDGKHTFTNPALEGMFGYSAEEMRELNPLSLVVESDLPMAAEKLRQALASEIERAEFSIRAKRKDGSVLDLEVHGSAMQVDGKRALILMSKDISARKDAERRLRDSEQMLRTIAHAARDAILMIDNDGRVAFWSDSAERIFGYTAGEAIGRDLHTLLTPPQYQHAWQAPFSNFRTTGEGPKVGTLRELSAQAKDGTEFPIEISLSAVMFDDKWNAVGVVRDITERKQAQQQMLALQDQLREQVIHDSLTGLYNRRYLEEVLARELILAERHGHSVSAIMGDLDHFKRINDEHGHLAGDEVLRTFGALMKAHARGSDIYCRYGGEEFLLLLPDMQEQAARARAEELRLALEATRVDFDGTTLVATGSFGVATFPRDARTGDELISAADKAMYAAKQAGRNQVATYSSLDDGQ